MVDINLIRLMINLAIDRFDESDIHHIVGVEIEELKSITSRIEDGSIDEHYLEKDKNQGSIFSIIMGVRSCFSALSKDEELVEGLGISASEFVKLDEFLQWSS